MFSGLISPVLSDGNASSPNARHKDLPMKYPDEPIHGSWCNTRTWPTKCPRCGNPTFFFQCDHKSRVFFDKLGPPWPVHNCDTSWANNLDRTQDSSGDITVKITETITVQRLPEGFSIDPSIISKASQRRRQPNQDPIRAIQPVAGKPKTTVVGTLHALKVEADVAKTLNIPVASAMALAFLGPLGTGKWSRVTLHEPLSGQNKYNNYTFWVASKNVTQAENCMGITVTAKISPLVISDESIVWLCEHFELLS